MNKLVIASENAMNSYTIFLFLAAVISGIQSGLFCIHRTQYGTVKLVLADRGEGHCL